MVIGPVIFTREDGVVIPCSSLGPDGAYIQPKFSKITAAPGAEVNFILVVQGASVFDTFARGRGDQFLREFSCVLVTGGDGQPDITTRAFLRKLKDQLSVPVYALVNPDPEGLSIFCTYKYGSPEGPFDNAGLTVPDIKWIGVHLGEALDLAIEDALPLTKQDISILEELCANKYVMGDDLFRTSIHFMLYRGLKSKIEALFSRQYPPSDYIRKEINNHEDT
jgi:meiotic recombination protein SPO11